MMNKNQTSSIVIGSILISLGIVFLILHNVANLYLEHSWPIIFFILSAGFYLPPLLLPSFRKPLASLFIPGSVMLALGIMFLYASLTDDWVSVSYSWTLIPAGVGLGLYLATRAGDWTPNTRQVGLYMLTISIAVFTLLASLFSLTELKRIAPIALILIGVIIMVQAMRKSK
ncbi:hypothetical protein JXO59_05905 [candidate division KSB1 bacterium]|nr:hypothetical protein [candidate division KSB1 bacterium]